MLRYETFPIAKGLLLATEKPDTAALAGAQTQAVRPWSEWTQSGALLLSDLIGLLAAYGLAYLLWARLVLHEPALGYIQLTPLLLLVNLVYASAGLYPGFGLGAVETIRRVFKSTSLAFLALAAMTFMLKEGPQYSRMTYVLAWACTLITVPLLRFMLLSQVHALRWWGKPTVVVGTRAQARQTIGTLKSAYSLGYRVVGVLSLDVYGESSPIEEVPVLGGLELAPSLSGAGVSTALVWDNPEIVPALERIQGEFRHLVLIRSDGILPLEHIRTRNLGGVLGIEFTNELLRRPNQIIKRAADVVMGSVLLLLALPVLVISGLLIKLVSPGPIFFGQEREGLDGARLTVWKLRTMYPDAEQRLQRLLEDNPQLRRQWDAHCKLSDDPRIVAGIGWLLRRFSIDELPQLWSVVTGHMSLVGPRPFPEYHLSMLGDDFRRLRRAVRPGLTGLWQVMVRSDGHLADQIRYDTYYIRNWSLWFDLYILARTAFAVLAGKGAC